MATNFERGILETALLVGDEKLPLKDRKRKERKELDINSF